MNRPDDQPQDMPSPDEPSAPIDRLPSELVAHILDQLGGDDIGALSLCMCLLASRRFHVFEPDRLWSLGRQMRAWSLDLDELAAVAPVAIVARLAAKNALSHMALQQAASRGNLAVVDCLTAAGYGDATDIALRSAIKKCDLNVIHRLADLPSTIDRVDLAVAAFETGDLRMMCGAYAALGMPSLDLESPSVLQRIAKCVYSRGDPAAIRWLYDRVPAMMSVPIGLGAALSTQKIEILDAALRNGLDHLDMIPHYAARYRLCLTAETVCWLASHADVLPTEHIWRTVPAIKVADYQTLDAIRQHFPRALACWAESYCDSKQHTVESLLADFARGPDRSLLCLLSLMQAGNPDAISTLCAHRRSVGVGVDLDALFAAGPKLEWWKRHDPRAFEPAVASALGEHACASGAYVQAAADAGAWVTVEWAIKHGSAHFISVRDIRHTTPYALDVLVAHRRLSDPERTVEYLIASNRVAEASRVLDAYPSCSRDAIALSLWDRAIHQGDTNIIDVGAALLGAHTIGSRTMGKAIRDAPLAVIEALAGHAIFARTRNGARNREWRCTREGIHRAMQRLHGIVLSRLVDPKRPLFAPDAFSMDTRPERLWWKRSLGFTASKPNMLDNAERVRALVGVEHYPPSAVDRAASRNDTKTVRAICATGAASCSQKAFTAAAINGNAPLIDLLLDEGLARPSTYAVVAALEREHFAIARRLVDVFEDQMVSGDVLIAAACAGCVDIARYVLKRTQHDSVRRFKRHTLRKAFLAAHERGHTNIVEIIEAYRNRDLV